MLFFAVQRRNIRENGDNDSRSHILHSFAKIFGGQRTSVSPGSPSFTAVFLRSKREWGSKGWIKPGFLFLLWLANFSNAASTASWTFIYCGNEALLPAAKPFPGMLQALFKSHTRGL